MHKKGRVIPALFMRTWVFLIYLETAGGDNTIKLYDVTNSKYIEPVPSDVYTTSNLTAKVYTESFVPLCERTK